MAPIVVSVILATGISLGVLGWQFSLQIDQEYQQGWQDRTGIFANTLGPMLNAVDIPLVQWSGHQVFVDESVLSVVIKNVLNDVVYSESRDGVAANQFESAIVSPIDQKTKIGHLQIIVAERSENFPLNDLLRVAGINIFLIITLTGIFIAVVRQNAIIPLNTLRDRINAVERAPHDDIKPAGKLGAPEINSLERSFFSALQTARVSERALALTEAQKGVLSNISNRALMSADIGVICAPRDADIDTIAIGMPLPQELSSLARSLEMGFPAFEDQISEIGGKILSHETQDTDALKHHRNIDLAVTIEFAPKRIWKIVFAGLDNTANALIFQDVSDDVHRARELNLAQKNDTIGKLTGGVAHDFNNILGIMLGNLEVFLLSHPNYGDNPQIVESISAISRGSKLTQSLLTFARKSSLNSEEFDLNALITTIINWTGRVLPDNIKIETVTHAGLWAVKTDVGMTENAVLNLIINARDAMPNGGALTIETSNVRIEEEYVWGRNETITPGRYVMLAVTDTGTGISPELIEEIFDPFFTTKEPGKGSGVGLAMVMGFMKQSHGTVRVYSELGEGTTFRLYFPAYSPSAVAALPPPIPVAKPTIGARILLVEDEPTLLEVTKRQLQASGYEVITAQSGDDGYDRYVKEGAENIDVILTDVIMPGKLNGPALVRKIRMIVPDVKVAFMSGYAKEATVHGNGLLQSDIRLMKPVERVELVRAIETLLQQ